MEVSASSNFIVDDAYEFNAPKYHDFMHESDEESHNDSFFRHAAEAELQPDTRKELHVSNEVLDVSFTDPPADGEEYEVVGSVLQSLEQPKEQFLPEVPATLSKDAPASGRKVLNLGFAMRQRQAVGQAVQGFKPSTTSTPVSTPRFHPYNKKTPGSASHQTPSRLTHDRMSVSPKVFSAARMRDLSTPRGASSRAMRFETPSSVCSGASKTPQRLTIASSPNLRTSSRSRLRPTLSASKVVSTPSGYVSDSAGSKRSISKVTNPVSPRLRTFTRTRNQDSKSTDDIQRQQAEEAIDQMIKRRRLAAEKLKSTLAPTGVAATPRSSTKLTTPRDFTFATSDRKKRVRSNHSFDTMSDGNYSDSDGEYVPIAERLRAFDRTPGRFRSRPSAIPTPERSTESLNSGRHKPTSPKEFRFQSETRVRTTHHIKSAKEIEEEQIAEAKKHQFKARPLDRRVLESRGDLGVPRVNKPELTQPRPFNFLVDTRAEIRSTHSATDTDSEMSYEFKARKFPKKIFNQGPSVQKSNSTLSLTEAHSPKLATASRAAVRPERPQESPKLFKAQPMPNFEKPFVPKTVEIVVTNPSPFRLRTEQKGEMYRKMLEEKKQKELEEEKRMHNFKARPIFSEDSSSSIRSQPAPVPTTVEPFSLKTDIRSELSTQRLQERLKREQQEEQNRANFKARPIIKGKPVAIAPSSKPLTDVSSFHLNVDKRSLERAAFENRKAEMEAQHMAEKLLQEEARREQEEREIAEMRKAMVPKANPIRFFNNVEPKRSTFVLTEPKSPELATRFRFRE